MPFKFQATRLEEVIVIESKSFLDERGYFKETFKESDFHNYGIPTDFPQENESFSRKGVLRGLHYQLPPFSQGKLVRVISGKVFDVAVDLRKNSKYFGQWVAEVLSSENNLMLWIPPCFAHGFMALEDSIVCYRASREYSKEHERGVIWNDPNIGIEWPLKQPTIIKRDMEFPGLKEAILDF